MPDVGIARIQKMGDGVCCYLPARVLRQVPMKRGDIVAVKAIGRAIVIERVPMEELGNVGHLLRKQSAE